VPAFFYTVKLYSLVALRGHAELARVIEVDRQDMGLRLALSDVIPPKQLEKGGLAKAQNGTELQNH
jgi:hypothetical protein